MTPSSRRGSFLPCRVLALCGLSLAALALPGCSLIQGPPLVPAPPIVQKPLFPVFDATDYLTPWTATKMPGFYRVTGVTSGEILTIQGVNMVPKGRTMTKQYGVPEAVRLSGIVAPAPGQPGWQNTTNKVSSWLAGKEDLEVEVDPKYPVDLNNRRMVQIYFHPSAKATGMARASSTGASSARSSSKALSSAGASSTGSSSVGASALGERWNLNRMLVHTGYAVVDLFGATSIDVQKWLNDEEFAKNYTDRKTGAIKPLGLWGLGITIPQRGIPTRARGAIAVVPGSASVIGSTVQGTLQSSRTTQTQQMTRTTTQTAPSSTGTTSGLPSGTSTMPSTSTPSTTTPGASTPSTPSTPSTTASASSSTTTRSATTPSSAATSTTSSATNSVSTSR